MTIPSLVLRREFVFLALAVLLGLGAAAAYWVSRATVLTIAARNKEAASIDERLASARQDLSTARRSSPKSVSNLPILPQRHRVIRLAETTAIHAGSRPRGSHIPASPHEKIA